MPCGSVARIALYTFCDRRLENLPDLGLELTGIGGLDHKGVGSPALEIALKPLITRVYNDLRVTTFPDESGDRLGPLHIRKHKVQNHHRRAEALGHSNGLLTAASSHYLMSIFGKKTLIKGKMGRFIFDEEKSCHSAHLPPAGLSHTLTTPHPIVKQKHIQPRVRHQNTRIQGGV